MTSPMLTKIAHRGASGYEPENTLKAFRKAIALGANMIECDVHLTKDGQLVVIHDDTVDRTTKSKGKVAEKTLEELRKLKISKTEKIPTLEEVLNLVQHFCKIDVEIKDSKATEKVVELVTKKNILADLLISSIHVDVIEKVNRLNPNIQTGLIVEKKWTRSLLNIGGLIPIFALKQVTAAKAQKVRATVICLDKELASEEIITFFHQQRLQVYVWTVNEEKEMKEIKSLGVDGIISNYPDRIR